MEEEIQVEEVELPTNRDVGLVRGGTFTRSLRFARHRMTTLSKFTKRLARSADDLRAIEEETEEKIKEEQKRMAPAKFSHPKKHEFDYNAALELEFEKWRKLYGGKEASLTTEVNLAPCEEKTSPGNLNFSISLSEIISRGRSTKSNKDSISPSPAPSSLSSRSSSSSSKESPRHPISRQLSLLSNKLRPEKGLPGQRLSTSLLDGLSTGLVEAMKGKGLKRSPSGSIALTPLRSEQYVRETRRTLMLDALQDRCECVITDKDDGEVQFSCVLSQEGIVCRNYRTMLDIVSIGCLQHLTEDDPIGVYYTIEGYRDGQIARIRKGKTFSRIKYHLSLVTPEDQRTLLSLPNSSLSPSSPLPVLKQSLIVYREWGNILKIRTKTANIPIATIQKEMSSQRYWLHLEPNVDCCFVSAIAAYLLRRKIFGDRLPKVLKSQRSNFVRRARRLSLSVRRRKRARPTSLAAGSPVCQSA